MKYHSTKGMIKRIIHAAVHPLASCLIREISTSDHSTSPGILYDLGHQSCAKHDPHTWDCCVFAVYAQDLCDLGPQSMMCFALKKEILSRLWRKKYVLTFCVLLRGRIHTEHRLGNLKDRNLMCFAHKNEFVIAHALFPPLFLTFMIGVTHEDNTSGTARNLECQDLKRLARA